MVTTNEQALYPAMEKFATSRSLVSLDIRNGDSKLAGIVGPHNTFVLADSVAAVGGKAQDANGGAIVFYDIEHWPGTPQAEQNDPVGSISLAADAAHAAHRLYGIAPDGLFGGRTAGACAFDVSKGIFPKLDWSKIDYLNIQSQELATDGKCSGTTQFTAFVKAVVAIARAQNPKIFISAQVSLRDSTPTTAIAAAGSVRSEVDAIYVAYPPAPCTNCSPDNLSTVLASLSMPVT